MKNTLEYIIARIIDGDATVTEEEQDGMTIFTVRAPKEEVGKIIGKGGKTINSLKNILKISAIRENKRIDIQVMEQT